MPAHATPQVVAVDWSGRATGAASAICLGRVVAGELVDLEDGRERAEVAERLIALARERPHTVVGLDFAFGFPAWYARREGWSTGRAGWLAMRRCGEELLRRCEPPFWGRTTGAQQLGEPLRRTEQGLRPRPKSVFQVGGAGAVGTGSVRGMPHLARLQDEGFAIWPFDDPGWPLVVEVYPRLFAPAVRRSRPADRREHLAQARFAGLSEDLRERAAASEHAFDAAVSALAMAERLPELASLPRLAADDHARVEGAIWVPGRDARPD